MTQKQKNIVILGGGFGGMTTVSQLVQHVKYNRLKDVKITLVDRKDYHLFHANLYEVATAEEEFVGNADLKKSVALPFKEFLPKDVDFVQGDVEGINAKEKTVVVQTASEKKTIHFDYLVVAMGSVSDDFGIPGIKENGLILSGLNDALKIRNALGFLVQSRRMELNKPVLRVVLGGGGFTGVELTSELLNLIDVLAWKNSYPREKIELMVIEGASQLMPGMPSVVSSTIYHRLRYFGVNVVLGQIIAGVEKDKVNLKNGEVIHHDLFIWTGGVKSAKVPFAETLELDRKGRLMTAPDLSVRGLENIYAIGDSACVSDPDGKPMPPTATQAIMHAEYVAAAITARMTGKVIPNYVTKPSPFIVPVKGKWAIMRLPAGFTMQGFIPWVAKSFASVRYFSRFMPLTKAIQLVFFEEKLYTRND